MAESSISRLFPEDINLNDLFEILSPQNNLVLADDIMLSDANGIILQVSETYEKNFGFAHGSIVGAHGASMQASRTVFETRQKLARLLGCPQAEHVVFTDALTR